MGSMTRPASDSLSVILSRLDDRVRRVDEERWLSSRYAPADQRASLIALYAFYYELARVRVSVSDPTLGQIRFQWWRDALTELMRGENRQHDVVTALAAETANGRLKADVLLDMVERFETAFLANDRDTEPEDLLAKAAAEICAPGGLDQESLPKIAMAWAKLRRGEEQTQQPTRARIPSRLRPALAHLRLRRIWARGTRPGPLQSRLCILMAVLTGVI
jgi:phytoene synthase